MHSPRQLFLTVCACLVTRLLPATAMHTFLGALVVFTSAFATFADEPTAASADRTHDEEFVIDPDCPRMCLPVLIDGKEYRFIIDTGAAETMFDPRLRPHLGEFRGRSFLDQENQDGVVLDEYGPPNAFVRHVPLTEKRTVRCFDFAAFGALDDFEYGGIVGVDFLKKYVVQFDLDAHRIRLLSKVPDGVGKAFPFMDDWESRPMIRVRISNNGYDLEDDFLVDTGAQGGLSVSQSEFRELFNSGQITYPELFRTCDANGTDIAIRGRLGCARFSSLQVRGVTVASDGDVKWIGMKCLSRFLVTVDFPGRVVYLKERKEFANQADRWDLSGMWLRRDSSETVVDSVMPASPGEAAGLRVNDVIESIDGVPTKMLSMLKIRRIFQEPGRSVKLMRRRDEEVMEATVLLKEYRKERPVVRVWSEE